jgi:hypothetical protein
MKTIKNVIQPDNAQSYPLVNLAVAPKNNGRPTTRKVGSELGQEGLSAFYGHVSETFTEKLQWPAAYTVYNEMWRRDPTLRSLILAVRLFANQSTIKAETPTDKVADRKAGDHLQTCIEDMSHTMSDFIDDALTALVFGWSSFEICYKWRQGPQGEHKSQFNDGYIGWRKFAPRRQSSFIRWNLDDTGGFGGWYQQAAPSYTEQLLPAEYLLHFVADRDGGNPEGISLFESAYEPWHFVKNLQIINGIGWQRTFVGLPVFETEEELSSTDKATIKAVGEGLTVDEKQYVSVPGGVKFRLESTTNSGAGALLETIKMYRALMLQIILGEFMMQSLLGTGSFAAQSDKSELFIMAVNGLLDKLLAVMNRFAVPRLFEFEANKFSGITELPQLTHTDIRKPNLPQLGAFVQQVAQFIKWGDEDVLWLRQQSGLPETVAEEEEVPEEPTGDTAPAGDSQSASNLEAGTVLNGAQVTAVIDTLEGLTAKTVVPLVAVELITSVGLPREIAERMVQAQEAGAEKPAPAPNPFQPNPPGDGEQPEPVTGEGDEPPEPPTDDTVEAAEFHEGKPIGLACPFCGAHKVVVFAEHGNACLCEECEMGFDHEYHYGVKYESFG